MSSHPEFEFSPEEQREMLALARSAILGPFTGQAPTISVSGPACLLLRRGVFVTVHVAGKLRGCIGVIEAHETLGASIIHCAESAAFHDRRFAPVRADEVSGLQIEISVLSELFPLDPGCIEIGKHGLLVTAGHYHGLLLPQVAVEHHLSRQQFLEETCYKAGLPRTAWRDSETRLFGFTCNIFHEENPAARTAD